MIHEMTLQPKSFSLIKSGLKTIESRLFDKKRKKILIGDSIIFYNKSNPEETMKVKVIDLFNYPTFSKMFADFPPKMFGGNSQKELEEQIYTYYSKEDEEKYSVLGIKIAKKPG